MPAPLTPAAPPGAARVSRPHISGAVAGHGSSLPVGCSCAATPAPGNEPTELWMVRSRSTVRLPRQPGYGKPSARYIELIHRDDMRCRVMPQAGFGGRACLHCGDQPIADAIASAYPEAVQRIARATGSPSKRSAAAARLSGAPGSETFSASHSESARTEQSARSWPSNIALRARK